MADDKDSARSQFVRDYRERADKAIKAAAKPSKITREIEWSSDDEVPIEVPEGEAPWKSKYQNARKDLHPLFWDKDDMPENPEDDPDLAALFNLMEEGSPAEIAENFKNRGNAQFKLGSKMKQSYYNAREEYSEAISAGNPDPKANSVYYSNRAAVEVALKNYGRVIADCKEAIKLDSENVKAYYRGALACNALTKSTTALKFARTGLSIDPENAPLQKQLEMAEQRLAKDKVQQEKRQQEQNVALAAKRQHAEELFPELKKRGIKLGKPLFNTQNEYPINVTLDAQGLLHWPVMFLYEEHHQSDFIRDVCETDDLAQHLHYMFPPAGSAALWDKEQKYILDNIELYVELGVTDPLPIFGEVKKTKRRFLRIRQTTVLGKLLSHPDYVVPHFPAVHVVVKPSKFREAFLARHSEDS